MNPLATLDKHDMRKSGSHHDLELMDIQEKTGTTLRNCDAMIRRGDDVFSSRVDVT